MICIFHKPSLRELCNLTNRAMISRVVDIRQSAEHVFAPLRARLKTGTTVRRRSAVKLRDYKLSAIERPCAWKFPSSAKSDVNMTWKIKKHFFGGRVLKLLAQLTCYKRWFCIKAFFCIHQHSLSKPTSSSSLSLGDAESEKIEFKAWIIHAIIRSHIKRNINGREGKASQWIAFADAKASLGNKFSSVVRWSSAKWRGKIFAVHGLSII